MTSRVDVRCGVHVQATVQPLPAGQSTHEWCMCNRCFCCCFCCHASRVGTAFIAGVQLPVSRATRAAVRLSLFPACIVICLYALGSARLYMLLTWPNDENKWFDASPTFLVPHTVLHFTVVGHRSFLRLASYHHRSLSLPPGPDYHRQAGIVLFWGTSLVGLSWCAHFGPDMPACCNSRPDFVVLFKIRQTHYSQTERKEIEWGVLSRA